MDKNLRNSSVTFLDNTLIQNLKGVNSCLQRLRKLSLYSVSEPMSSFQLGDVENRMDDAIIWQLKMISNSTNLGQNWKRTIVCGKLC